jgi:MipA family protein
MSVSYRRLVTLAAALALFAGPVAAQEGVSSGPQYVIDLGGGVGAKPQYPGADKYIFLPYPIIQAGRFYIPMVGQTEQKLRGFYFFPSFNIIGERSPSDDASLRGTNDIDWAFEAGVGAGFRSQWFRTFASVRQGFGGYDGQVGDLGLDLLVPLGPRFDVAFGPRASWGSSSYMETYYGVTPAESARGSLPVYRPDGGFESLGLAAEINYWITDTTRLQLKGSWDRLLGDAGDSPIVKAGSRDQWMAGIGISHRFSFDVFR